MESTRPSSLKLIEVHIDLIIPNPENVNEMDADSLQRLVEEIREVGFIDPVDLLPRQDEKFFLLGGEHRWKAAKIAGLQYVPAIIHTSEKWTDQDFVDLVAFRLNALRGSQNPEKFLKLYDRMAKKFGPESLQDIFAVTDKSLWKKITKGVKTNLKKAGMTPEMLSQVSEAENKSKDFNQFSKYLNKIFQAQAIGANTKCIVFVSQERENIIVQSSDNLFTAIKTLHDLSAQKSISLSDLLEPAILKLIAEIGNQNP